jgi:hypothetical protein
MNSQSCTCKSFRVDAKELAYDPADPAGQTQARRASHSTTCGSPTCRCTPAATAATRDRRGSFSGAATTDCTCTHSSPRRGGATSLSWPPPDTARPAPCGTPDPDPMMPWLRAASAPPSSAADASSRGRRGHQVTHMIDVLALTAATVEATTSTAIEGDSALPGHGSSRLASSAVWHALRRDRGSASGTLPAPPSFVSALPPARGARGPWAWPPSSDQDPVPPPPSVGLPYDPAIDPRLTAADPGFLPWGYANFTAGTRPPPPGPGDKAQPVPTCTAAPAATAVTVNIVAALQGWVS